MQLIDLTHTFTTPMPVYPGDPLPQFNRVASLHTEGYSDSTITTGMHIGTHIDAPEHMIAGGAFLDSLPLDAFAGRGVLVDVRNKIEISAAAIKGVSLQAGDVILFWTGWSERYTESAYFESFPPLTEELAHLLVTQKVKMIGLDSASPDKPPFSVHKILLESSILILENLANLAALETKTNFEVMAFPPKFHAGGSPVRAVARVS